MATFGAILFINGIKLPNRARKVDMLPFVVKGLDKHLVALFYTIRGKPAHIIINTA